MLDIRVKERLTGAIILVALLVFLVPELLTGPGRSASSAQTPANADGAQMRQYTIDLADGAAPHTGTAPPAVETPAPGARPAEGSGQSQASDVAASGDGSTPVESGSAQPLSGAPAARVDVPTPAAPAPRAEAASKAKEALNRRAAESPTVEKPTPPARAASAPAVRPASVEARPASGWVVQVGSFASRENADRLTRELKGKGFAATSSESSGKGKKRLWRVRVGPEADRAAAIALGTKLRSAGHGGGAVVPYP